MSISVQIVQTLTHSTREDIYTPAPTVPARIVANVAGTFERIAEYEYGTSAEATAFALGVLVGQSLRTLDAPRVH